MLYQYFKYLQLKKKSELADNVAVINGTDLSPMIERSEVKEIKELIDPKTSRPVELSLKVAQLPTTTPIEVIMM